MNEGVFSGGVFALMDAKRCLNATFVGTESGQGANHYGNMKWSKVGDKEFCWSTRYFNGTTVDTKQSVESFHLVKPVFDYTGPIKPDIYLPEKPEDVRLGIDGQLRDSLDIIKKELDLENILTAV